MLQAPTTSPGKMVGNSTSAIKTRPSKGVVAEKRGVRAPSHNFQGNSRALLNSLIPLHQRSRKRNWRIFAAFLKMDDIKVWKVHCPYKEERKTWTKDGPVTPVIRTNYDPRKHFLSCMGLSHKCNKSGGRVRVCVRVCRLSCECVCVCSYVNRQN